uniref:Uncharacterized protein n=1 Tax=Pristionchus pacificus TaxID=54126 RepID=A0A2A6BEP3_PRIPA|eukprot:PDM64281.1 hypothetical protein PRIPAC_53656 [Pristionchus pacificus]
MAHLQTEWEWPPQKGGGACGATSRTSQSLLLVYIFCSTISTVDRMIWEEKIVKIDLALLLPPARRQTLVVAFFSMGCLPVIHSSRSSGFIRSKKSNGAGHLMMTSPRHIFFSAAPMLSTATFWTFNFGI